MKRYVTRDRVSGNVIDCFNTIDEAKAAINLYEQEDRKDGCFESDFYEIYDLALEEVVY